MDHVTRIPQGYSPLLSIYETQKAISLLHRLFEDKLSGALRLHRVSAPLFVSKSSRHQRRPERCGAPGDLRHPGHRGARP